MTSITIVTHVSHEIIGMEGWAGLRKCMMCRRNNLDLGNISEVLQMSFSLAFISMTQPEIVLRS